MKTPETSIVIRTFNEERYLPHLLEAIREQDYTDYEVVVVDSGSYDLTCEIAEQHDVRLIHIDSRDFTFGYSLNTGIDSSKGRLIAIVSAHTKPRDSSWLSSLIEPLRDDQVAMVYGRQLGGTGSKFADVQDFERTFGAERKILKPPHFFANNANSAIRKDLWNKHRFDETLPGLEDIEWAKHWMGKAYLVIYQPDAALYHIHNETWGQVCRRYYREALAAKRIGVKGPGHIPIEIGREWARLFGDLVLARREGHLRKMSREIFQYRYYKTLGTVRGLWDGAVLEDPRRNEALYFDRSRSAVVIEAPGKVELRDMEIPQIKPGEVLIRVAYAGVCPVDVGLFEGRSKNAKDKDGPYPIIPGHELSGEVVKVGSNVSHLREGDLVVGERVQGCGTCKPCQDQDWSRCRRRKEVGIFGRNGAYTEFMPLPGIFVHRLPESTDLKAAVLCEPLAAVLSGLSLLELVYGSDVQKTCAVIGNNPVGRLCAQVMVSRGQEVTILHHNSADKGPFSNDDTQVLNCENLDEIFKYPVLIEATGNLETLDEVLSRKLPSAPLLMLGHCSMAPEYVTRGLKAADEKIVGPPNVASRDFVEAIGTLSRLGLSRFSMKTFSLHDYRDAWELSRTSGDVKVILEIRPRMR